MAPPKGLLKCSEQKSSTQSGSTLTSAPSSIHEVSSVSGGSSSSSESGSVTPSSTTSSTPFPGNVTALLQQQQLQQTTSQQAAALAALAQNNNMLEQALSQELKRAQVLKTQLAVLDKVTIAQAAADQQKAALLASAGLTIPSALQQAVAMNSLLLGSSLAAQALAPQIGAAQPTLPLQTLSLSLVPSTQVLLDPLLSVNTTNGVVAVPPVQIPIGPNNGNTMAAVPVISNMQLNNKNFPYRDASLIPDPIVLEKGSSKTTKEPFPTKIHRMLAELEKAGQADIASFLPHGRAFMIHKPKKFTNEIMPKYFRMSHFSSFQRQLNLCEYLNGNELRWCRPCSLSILLLTLPSPSLLYR